MKLQNLIFSVIDWDTIQAEEHIGLSGKTFWKIVQQGDLRVRIVEYTPGYVADHWCTKGHIVFVIDGEFTSELKDGRKHHLTKGMSYIVADNAEAHRSSTIDGVKLLIVD